jgi:predicted enzyme related to lactoylglutathione lyase
VQLSYRIDDIAAAVERVRAAGGHADEPEPKPYGLIAECVDDQGATFRLWQPADMPER